MSGDVSAAPRLTGSKASLRIAYDPEPTWRISARCDAATPVCHALRDQKHREFRVLAIAVLKTNVNVVRPAWSKMEARTCGGLLTRLLGVGGVHVRCGG